jgi:hypothetical protein
VGAGIGCLGVEEGEKVSSTAPSSGNLRSEIKFIINNKF